MGQPLSMDFHVFETVTLLLTVIMVTALVQDGKANWLKGVMLVMAYLILAGAYWTHEDPPDLAT